jgi:hypothetical protein
MPRRHVLLDAGCLQCRSHGHDSDALHYISGRDQNRPRPAARSNNAAGDSVDCCWSFYVDRTEKLMERATNNSNNSNQPHATLGSHLSDKHEGHFTSLSITLSPLSLSFALLRSHWVSSLKVYSQQCRSVCS